MGGCAARAEGCVAVLACSAGSVAAYACMFESMRGLSTAAPREEEAPKQEACAEALLIGAVGVAELGADAAWEVPVSAVRLAILARGSRSPLLLYGIDTTAPQHVYAALGALVLSSADGEVRILRLHGE